MHTIRDLAKIPETSVAQGLNYCNACGVCCRVSPCLLLPKDVARLQAYGLQPEHLQIEHTPSGRWVVRMRPQCVFLDGNLCRVHDVKPTGGRDFRCWTENEQTYYWSPEELGAIGFRLPGSAKPVATHQPDVRCASSMV